MDVRTILFDFDGTLADSYPAITASVNHVRGFHGLRPLPIPEVRRHVGRGPEYLLEKTVPLGKVADNVASYKCHHPSVMREGTQLFPGVMDTLHALVAKGKQLGICSNKPVAFTRDLLEQLEISSVFRAVLGPDDVPRPKPAPDMLLAALERVNARPRETLYVGDMVVDIHTARAAGVPVWIVPTGSDDLQTLRAAEPDRLLANLQELCSLV